MTKLYASVYGCPSNISDCEISLGLLQEAGFEIVDSSETSDINILFTCIVKAPTEQRMITEIQKLTDLRKPLIVAGCMTKTSQRTIEKINPNAVLVGPDSIEHIVAAVKASLDGRKIIYIKDERKTKPGHPRIKKRKEIGIIPISIGCLSNCSYCAVKLARGKLKSYPADEILKDVKYLSKSGCKEIWLTSQDNGCYGADRNTYLAALIRSVCEVEGDFKIRVGMLNPTYVKNEKILDNLIDAYKHKKVLKFLHLPVQSGSNKILRLMNRRYVVKDFEKIVSEFRKEIPNLFLSTDIIVGFPEETEEDFQLTVGLLKKIKPNKVNISKFGIRSETESAKMKQLDVKTINRRSREIHKLISSF